MLIEDSVRQISSRDSAEKVIFKKHSGVYYLHSGSKHYKSIKAALELSQKSGGRVQIKTDPTTMEIEELISGPK